MPDEPEMIPVESIRRLDVHPGESLLVQVSRPLDAQTASQIRDQVRARLPEGVEVLVVDSNVMVSVVAKEP